MWQRGDYIILAIRSFLRLKVMRIEWKQVLWSQRRLLLARIIAESLYRAVIGQDLPTLPPELKTKAIGYDGYPSLEQPG